jgi:hypothetical protein
MPSSGDRCLALHNQLILTRSDQDQESPEKHAPRMSVGHCSAMSASTVPGSVEVASGRLLVLLASRR